MHQRAPRARWAFALVLVGLLSWLVFARPGALPGGSVPGQGDSALALPTGTLSFRLAPSQAATLPPTVTPTLAPAPSAGPLVWIGGEGCLTVLGPEGWRVFPMEGIVRDIAIDNQGTALIAPGLCMSDGRLLRSLLPRAPGGEQDAVAIDPQGRVWVGHYGGIAVLEGGQWAVVPIQGPNVPDKARMVTDLAIDSHGVIWVGTKAGLARCDGHGWLLYSESSGLANSIDCIMIDHLGQVWVGHEKGLSVLQGSRWRHFPLDEIGFVRGLATDPHGRILAGSLYRGISLFDGESWITWADATLGLPSNRITALAHDGAGRVWVGTRIGLSVFDGRRWITYQEANSGLGDNQVSSLAVNGALPSLPVPGSLRYGRLVGRVTRSGQAASGVRVMLCPELSLAQTYGDSPCQDPSLCRLARTGPDGSYEFDRVPVGHYAVAAEVDPGRWVTQARVLSAVRYAVREGKVTTVGPIEGSER